MPIFALELLKAWVPEGWGHLSASGVDSSHVLQGPWFVLSPDGTQSVPSGRAALAGEGRRRLRLQEPLQQRLLAVGKPTQWPCRRLQNGWRANGGRTEAVGREPTVIPGDGEGKHPAQAQACPQWSISGPMLRPTAHGDSVITQHLLLVAATIVLPPTPL